VDLLLAAGADVNVTGGYYGTALQAASTQGYKEIVSLLLAAGADVNATGGHYGTALQAASYEGSGEIVSLVLAAGAEVNAMEGTLGTALQAACCKGLKDVVGLLLNAGADINVGAGIYGTPLVHAIGCCNNNSEACLEVVTLLVQAGARVKALGKEYSIALERAEEKQWWDVAKLLRARGAKTRDDLRFQAVQVEDDASENDDAESFRSFETGEEAEHYLEELQI
jgi:ankyrin repeat protein